MQDDKRLHQWVDEAELKTAGCARPFQDWPSFVYAELS
jgi:hypothetical protein